MFRTSIIVHFNQTKWDPMLDFSFIIAVWFFRERWLIVILLGVDSCSIRQEAGSRNTWAPRGVGPAGHAACCSSGGGSRSSGKRGVNRTSLEATRQSAKDRATTTQTAAAVAATERDSLASQLALAEAKVEKLRAAAVSAEEATERAKTTAAAIETAAQAAAREKAELEARVSEL
jgi:hypothetical protein